jgi:flagellar biosynthesis/type III secretory pathway protein FliH
MVNDPENKKYFFDLHNFDVDAEAEKKKAKEPPEPTFSMKDMEQARNESYEKGKSDGMEAAKESIEKRTEVVVQSLAGQLQQLESQEQNRKYDYEQSSLVLVYKTLKKVFPSLFHETKEAEVQLFLQKFFQETQNKIGFNVTIHHDLKDSIQKHVETLHPNSELTTNDTMPPNAATITWAKGSAHYDPEEMAQKLLDIIMDKIDDKAELLDDSSKTPHNEDSIDDQNSQSSDSQQEDNA